MKDNSLNIVIGGDIYPKGKVENYFVEGNSNKIFNDLLPVLKNADYSVVNLECPLTDTESPILKDGAALRAQPKTINGINSSGIDAVNLSNNHILDQDANGLKDTIKTLKDNDVAYFGAGKNLKASRVPHIVKLKGKSIAFLGIAEHEFSIATDDSFGAYPLNIPDNIRLIQELKSNTDYIIILYHGGKEHYAYPTPNQQDISRFFIEQGADAVIAQHSHIFGSYEEYQGKLIVYGQGNLIFEKLSRNNESWFYGFLVSLKLSEEKIDFEFIPFEQSNGFVGAKRLLGDKGKSLLSDMELRSKQVVDEQFVNSEWKKLCAKDISLYKSRMHGHNRILRVLNRKLNFANWIYPKWKGIMIRNVIECETHREGLETLWNDKNIKF